MLEAQKVLDEYWRRVVEEEKGRYFEGISEEGRVPDRETWCVTTSRVRPPQGKPPGPQPGDYRPCRCRRDG